MKDNNEKGFLGGIAVALLGVIITLADGCANTHIIILRTTNNANMHYSGKAWDAPNTVPKINVKLSENSAGGEIAGINQISLEEFKKRYNLNNYQYPILDSNIKNSHVCKFLNTIMVIGVDKSDSVTSLSVIGKYLAERDSYGKNKNRTTTIEQKIIFQKAANVLAKSGSSSLIKAKVSEFEGMKKHDGFGDERAIELEISNEGIYIKPKLTSFIYDFYLK